MNRAIRICPYSATGLQKSSPSFVHPDHRHVLKFQLKIQLTLRSLNRRISANPKVHLFFGQSFFGHMLCDFPHAPRSTAFPVRIAVYLTNYNLAQLRKHGGFLPTDSKEPCYLDLIHICKKKINKKSRAAWRSLCGREVGYCSLSWKSNFLGAKFVDAETTLHNNK